MLELRDHLRAAALTIVLVVHGIAASPLPKSVKRAQFETAMAREELDRWAGILGGVGIAITREELAERSYAIGTDLAALRTTLLGPARPWFRLSGTGQAWGLFTYPDSWPHQLVVEIRVGTEWRTIYAGLDPDAAWRRDQLAYRRVRGVYDGNSSKPGKSYQPFVNWIGRLALADFPEAEEARVKFLRFHTRAPGEPQDPEVLEKFARTVAR